MLKNNSLQAPFLFLLITISASIFRIANLDLIEFKGDEAINMYLAAQPLFGHPMPPGGTVSSVGILNPPLLNYLLFPILNISLDPRFSAFFIGLANTIAIGFLFLVVKKYYGLSVALITTLFLALSPWSILFSRKIWMQDLLLPFFVPFFFSLHKLLLEKNIVYWTMYTTCSLFLIQLHQISVLFVGITSIFLLQKVRFNLKYIAIGLLIGFLPLLPYIFYQVQQNCPDCQTVLSVNRRLSPGYNLKVLQRPLQIVSQGNFNFLLGDDMVKFAKDYPLIYQLRKLLYLEYLLLPIGMFLFAIRFRKSAFLVYATVLLVSTYFILKIEPYMHYYIIILPLLFLFLASAIAIPFDYKNKLIKTGSIMLFLILLITSFAFNAVFFDLLQKQKALKGDYGTTLHVTEKNTLEKLNRYRDRPDFQEIVLASYIPIDQMFGYMPISRMLYQDEISKERLLLLEKEWGKNPDDARIQHEILAYYTRNKPTQETIDVLREKSKSNPLYQPFYKIVYEDYLHKHFKKAYKSKQFGFEINFPEHWSIEEENNMLTLKVDEYQVVIKPVDLQGVSFVNNSTDKTYKKSSMRILGSATDKILCRQNHTWCGTLYHPLTIDQRKYIVGVERVKDGKSVSITDEKLLKTTSAVEEAMQSIRK